MYMKENKKKNLILNIKIMLCNFCYKNKIYIFKIKFKSKINNKIKK